MFAIRRCALRTLSQQCTRSVSTLRPTGRVTIPLQSVSPSLLRPFHQSRIWMAVEGKTEAEKAEASPAEVESNGETVLTEPTTESIKEESTFKPEPETFTEQAKEYASSAAQTVSDAATSTFAAATAPFQSRSRQWPGQDGASSSATPTRILYVGNLFFEATEPQLQSVFEEFGKVVNTRIVTDPRGMSKGFGYIEFAEQQSADRAVQDLNQQPFQGRRMAVQYHVRRERKFDGPPPPPREARNPPSKTLFIGNMSYQMSDRDLNDLFREIRNVIDVRVAIDRRTGQPRGFAHADFIDTASAEKAKELLQEKVVYGRQLRIDFSAQASRQES